jgi:hypothetical protein
MAAFVSSLAESQPTHPSAQGGWQLPPGAAFPELTSQVLRPSLTKDQPRPIPLNGGWLPFQRRPSVLLYRGAQEEYFDKGKPAVRPGRKAMGLYWRDRQAAEKILVLSSIRWRFATPHSGVGAVSDHSMRV